MGVVEKCPPNYHQLSILTLPGWLLPRFELIQCDRILAVVEPNSAGFQVSSSADRLVCRSSKIEIGVVPGQNDFVFLFGALCPLFYWFFERVFCIF